MFSWVLACAHPSICHGKFSTALVSSKYLSLKHDFQSSSTKIIYGDPMSVCLPWQNSVLYDNSLLDTSARLPLDISIGSFITSDWLVKLMNMPLENILCITLLFNCYAQLLDYSLHSLHYFGEYFLFFNYFICWSYTKNS